MIKELFQLLTPRQRRHLYRLQILVILMAIMELIGIASIGPFMALVADRDLIETNSVLQSIYRFSGLHSPNQLLFVLGVGVLFFLGVASVLSIITTWRMSLFAMQTGSEIADRLYAHYLRQGWLFHACGSSSRLTKQISTESIRVTNGVILPLTQLNARVVVALLISVSIVLYKPVVALSGLALFLFGYFLIYRVVRRRLEDYGKLISEASTQRFRLMNEGFGGIKDVLLLDRSKSFTEQFSKSGNTLSRAQGVNLALAQAPRYFMEMVAFGAMIILVLVLIKVYDGVLSQVLPVLAVYALAGFKLLPALQQIYFSITTIRANLSAFDSIRDDLIASQQAPAEIKSAEAQFDSDTDLLDVEIAKELTLEKVSFKYPGASKVAIDSVSLSISLNTTVGFVGESGSGKSTIVDIIIGMIAPTEGEIRLDASVISESNLRAWQKNIGFVPQSIFLSEGSIAENIAFGIRPSDINLAQVEKVIRLAHLEELVRGLPDGLATKIGERGVKLSGGQRQRIGIARALYNEAAILVFDEATSALDGITEKTIMDAIHELSGQRTIILIAHRLKTIQQCENVFMMDRGKLVDQGSYEDLIQRNKQFRRMARLS